jgi:hypothetical protein
MRYAHHQTATFKAPDRFSQRAPANTECGAQILFAQARARSNIPFDNGILDTFKGAVRQRLAAAAKLGNGQL